MKVLCITLNPAIDLTLSVNDLNVGQVNRAYFCQSDPAGKGLNAAQILSDLGFDTIASGFLGKQNAAIFEQLFTHRHQLSTHAEDCLVGVLRDEFVRVVGETRINVKIDAAGITTDINGKGFFVSHQDKLALLSHLAPIAKECQAVLVAGSLPLGFETEDFDELLSILTMANDKVAVDVSGAALEVALRHQLWLIKPNDDELAQVFGQSATNLARQSALLKGLDIEHVVVSMGERGVNWFVGDEIYHSIPPKMTVKSTVGAGDTLTAGMMAGLLHKLPPKDILARATALSAHAVSIVGFKAASQDRMTELLPQVSVQRLSHR
ncbi:1-phosphofructokinase [Moraxella sp. Tifton1]|uniref:Phosphofructokinase n=1 Tax=Moraxella oculi TaxID=2940516 RepID=A0ABW8U8W7_9GAMM|nr:1-phosphofructokinase [Moraxella sp. Tifton1]MCL1623675.1 1-phosphofructokinase [Moraxella sp. Tifton1]